jgi:transcriptional regulator with XRE-family HTH domain
MSSRTAPLAATSPRYDPMDSHIGGRLKARRVVSNLSQERLADQMGVSFQQLHKYETGLNRISSSMLFRAAKALNVGVEYFFNDCVDPSAVPGRRIDRSALETARQLERIENVTVRENLRLLIKKLAGEE